MDKLRVFKVQGGYFKNGESLREFSEVSKKKKKKSILMMGDEIPLPGPIFLPIEGKEEGKICRTMWN